MVLPTNLAQEKLDIWDKMDLYREEVIFGLETFAVMPRRRGEPNGNTSELAGEKDVDIRNSPEDLVKIIREGLHLLYQKDTSARVLGAALRELKRGKIDQ